MRKHLFIVHSSITWRMTQAVIRYHQIAGEDVVLLLDRGFRPEVEGVTQIDISNWTLAVFRWQDRRKLLQTCRQNRRNRARLDQMLTEGVGEPFRLYLPHSWSYGYLALMAHRLCREYAFIEEGTLSYNPDLSIYDRQASWFKQLSLRLLLTACLGKSLPVFPEPLQHGHPKYRACYCISERAFPTLPAASRHVLPAPFSENARYRSIRDILISGPWIELQYCTEAQYRELKTALFRYFMAQGVETLHVKFHPLQYHRMESIPIFREIAAAFAPQLTVIELSPQDSPEEIAFSSSANFYLAYSSVTIYAHQFGCRIYSYARPMHERWPAFRKVFDGLPAIITDPMTFIGLNLADGKKDDL